VHGSAPGRNKANKELCAATPGKSVLIDLYARAKPRAIRLIWPRSPPNIRDAKELICLIFVARGYNIRSSHPVRGESRSQRCAYRAAATSSGLGECAGSSGHRLIWWGGSDVDLQ